MALLDLEGAFRYELCRQHPFESGPYSIDTPHPWYDQRVWKADLRGMRDNSTLWVLPEGTGIALEYESELGCRFVGVFCSHRRASSRCHWQLEVISLEH